MPRLYYDRLASGCRSRTDGNRARSPRPEDAERRHRRPRASGGSTSSAAGRNRPRVARGALRLSTRWTTGRLLAQTQRHEGRRVSTGYILSSATSRYYEKRVNQIYQNAALSRQVRRAPDFLITLPNEAGAEAAVRCRPRRTNEDSRGHVQQRGRAICCTRWIDACVDASFHAARWGFKLSSRLRRRYSNGGGHARSCATLPRQAGIITSARCPPPRADSAPREESSAPRAT